MLIEELVNKYISLGHSFRNAQNLAAEEIVLRKIASSPFVNKITLKGGIVMYNLTKNDRRVTQDIDFDFIKYSIDVESVRIFVDKLNQTGDNIFCKIQGKLEKLHHEDYNGVRANIVLQDEEKSKLKIKFDIGVESNLVMEQDQLLFMFENFGEAISLKVNSCEQIFAEKLVALGRFGLLTTRYKDIYDLYFLLKNNYLDSKKLIKYLDLLLSSSSKKPNSIKEIVMNVIDTLNDENFAIVVSKPLFKWIDEDYFSIKNEIIRYIESFFNI